MILYIILFKFYFYLFMLVKLYSVALKQKLLSNLNYEHMNNSLQIVYYIILKEYRVDITPTKFHSRI